MMKASRLPFYILDRRGTYILNVESFYILDQREYCILNIESWNKGDGSACCIEEIQSLITAIHQQLIFCKYPDP